MNNISFFLVITNLILILFHSSALKLESEISLKTAFSYNSHRIFKRMIMKVLNTFNSVNNVGSEVINQFEMTKGTAQYGGRLIKDAASLGTRNSINAIKKTAQLANTAKKKYHERSRKNKEKSRET